MFSHLPIRALLALMLAVTLWASGFAGIRAGLHAYAPAHLALLRYFTASMVLAAYARLAYFDWVSRHHLLQPGPELRRDENYGGRSQPAGGFDWQVGLAWW
jgi:hypothetical protein